jgi:starch phosphorylase
MPLPEIKTKATAQIEIPVQFSRLRDIAYNFWWSWTPAAIALFNMIDPWRWERYRNPIELLIDLEPERWHAVQAQDEFIRAYRATVEQFDAYIAPEGPTWFQRHHVDLEGRTVAYFSTEFGWHECLQVYSGGLGILSGDHAKSASDLGLPFVGVGLAYRRGYFRQTVDADGHQQHFYPDYDLHRVPLLPVVDRAGHELELALEFPDRSVYYRVWKATVGRVPVLLLDTDIAKNHPADRRITSILYISGREMRLCQEIILGMGGVQTLNALGIAPDVWHINEGHSALLSLQRLRDVIIESKGPFDEACRKVAGNAVFTTHTPVPAGNESFDAGLVRKYLAGWAAEREIDLEQVLALGRDADPQSFNMTALALRTSARANGVSELHGRVADEMWRHLLAGEPGRKIEYVTNGVHLPTWIGPEMRRLLDRHQGADFEHRLLEPGFAEAVQAIPDEEIWAAHCAQKRRLVNRVRELTLGHFARHGHAPDDLRRLDQLLNAEVLLVGFARRFATYKRADLILRELDKLKQMVAQEERPIQFLFAGKAHPADRPGQQLIRRIWQASLDPQLRGRLLFVENYDMHVGRYMVQGVDLWLNNPRRPLEASGTSGMKAAMNGGLNCSVLDGWWCEGYDASHGWVIGRESSDDPEQQDATDALDLYRLLEQEIVPCYYAREGNGLPTEWIQRMKRALGLLSPRFSTTRMVREYAEKYYVPAANGELAAPRPEL